MENYKGYYVKLINSYAILYKENHSEILERWHEMNNKKYDNIKSGSVSDRTGILSKHYSWMPTDYDKITHTAQEVLKHLSFEFSENEKGDIIIEGFDNRSGQENLFFKKIGDLVPAGSLMQWSVSGGGEYAWVFDGAKMQELSVKEALIIVKDSEPFQKVEQTTEKPKKKSRYQL